MATFTLTNGQFKETIKVYHSHLPDSEWGEQVTGRGYDVREDWWEVNKDHRRLYFYCSSALGHAGNPCGFCGQDWGKYVQDIALSVPSS